MLNIATLKHYWSMVNGHAILNSCCNCDFIYFFSYAGCEAYICDFHREQCWERWVSLVKHGVSSVKDEVLAHLRQIAKASTVEGYKSAVSRLKNSNLWHSHITLQQWFEKTWLPQRKVYTINQSSMGLQIQVGLSRINCQIHSIVFVRRLKN